MADVLVPGQLRGYVAVAITRLCRQMTRDGYAPPTGLAELAAELLRDGERDALARRRELSAARSRRYRARHRSQQAS